MLVTILAITTTVLGLAAAAFAWRYRTKSKDRRRRLVFGICAAGFIAVAITETCIALLH
jgi:hypothetical protein